MKKLLMILAILTVSSQADIQTRTTIYPSGNIKEQYKYNTDTRKKVGIYTRYFDTYQRLIKQDYLYERNGSGKRVGEQREYYFNGNMKKLKFYPTPGIKSEEITYRNDLNNSIEKHTKFRYNRPFGAVYQYYPSGNIQKKWNYKYSGKVDSLREFRNDAANTLEKTTEYYFSGRKHKIIPHDGNKRTHGWIQVYRDDYENSIERKENWVHGFKDGNQYVYYPSGKVYQHFILEDGTTKLYTQKRDDCTNSKEIQKFYYPNGKVKSYAEFNEQEEFHGEKKSFTQDGELAAKAWFENGIEIKK